MLRDYIRGLITELRFDKEGHAFRKAMSDWMWANTRAKKKKAADTHLTSLQRVYMSVFMERVQGLIDDAINEYGDIDIELIESVVKEYAQRKWYSQIRVLAGGARIEIPDTPDGEVSLSTAPQIVKQSVRVTLRYVKKYIEKQIQIQKGEIDGTDDEDL